MNRIGIHRIANILDSFSSIGGESEREREKNPSKRKLWWDVFISIHCGKHIHRLGICCCILSTMKSNLFVWHYYRMDISENRVSENSLRCICFGHCTVGTHMLPHTHTTHVYNIDTMQWQWQWQWHTPRAAHNTWIAFAIRNFIHGLCQSKSTWPHICTGAEGTGLARTQIRMTW